jgi:hypothetical protein
MISEPIESDKSAADVQREVEAIVSKGPAGALALAGTAVALVLALWFLFYFFVFLPNGRS